MARTYDPAWMAREHSINFRDRLLAEAVRLDETSAGAGPSPGGLPEAPTIEHRIVRRAARLDADERIRRAIDRAARTARIVVVAVLAIAALAGLGAAGAVLGAGGERPVNLVTAIGSLLGVQTLLLVAWAVLMVTGARALRDASIGGGVVALSRWAAGKVSGGGRERAAVSAVASVQTSGAIGRWTLSTLSHGAWLAFNLGALAALLYALSARHYAFAWETTILSRDAFARLFDVLSAPMRALGLPLPSEDAVLASEHRPTGDSPFDQAEGTRRAWAAFLVGAVALYGAAPRALLVAATGALRGAALRRYRLDLSRPYYVELTERATAERREEGAPSTAAADDDRPRERSPVAARPSGPPAVIGLEVDEPSSGWPPPFGVAIDDLGRVDSGEEQHAALERLRDAETEPSTLVIVAELAATPDRGIERFASSLVGAVSRPPAFVLTPGRAMVGEETNDASARRAETRFENWKALAERAGGSADRVYSVDLDRLTDRSRATLRSIVEPSNGARRERPRRLGEAFGLIAEAAERGRLERERDRLDLHERVSRLYGASAAKGLLSRLGAGDLLADPSSAVGAMRDGAQRFTALLPEWLRAEPRWLAAGAVAGALGCASVATLVAPAAIGALPLWTGFGAALASLGPALRSKKEPDGETPVDVGESVRAAALWAMALELQGAREDAIRRVLAGAIPASRAGESIDRAGARAWLDQTRDDFERACEREGLS